MNGSSCDEIVSIGNEDIIIKKDEMLVLSFSKIVLRISRKKGRHRNVFSEAETYICVEALDKKKIHEYNNLPSERWNESSDLIKKILGKTGENINIEAPFHCDYG